MAEGKFSAVGLIKNFLLCLLVFILLLLAMPTAHVVSNAIDNNIVTSLLENVVKEGEKDKLYGVDQIYSYLQKGLNENNVKLQARDIIKADNAGSYVILTLDYRKDSKIFGHFYLSNVYYQTYKANLK